MSFLSVFRTVAFILAIVFAITSLCLAITRWKDVPNAGFILITISTSFTVAIIPVYLIIDIKRKGAVTSMIFVEILTTTFLWSLWLSSTSAIFFLQNLCYNSHQSYYYYYNKCTILVHGVFSFLNFINLFGYSVTLLIFSIVAHHRGHRPWKQSVKYTNFFASKDPPADLISSVHDEVSVAKPSLQDQDSTKPVSPTTTPSTILPFHDNLIHPGFLEPQASEFPGLRSANSIISNAITANDGLPPPHSPLMPSSPISYPAFLQYSYPPAHPGYPEPHANMSPGLRNVSSTGTLGSDHGRMPSLPDENIHMLASYYTASPAIHPGLGQVTVPPGLRDVNSNISLNRGIADSPATQNLPGPGPPMYPML